MIFAPAVAAWLTAPGSTSAADMSSTTAGFGSRMCARFSVTLDAPAEARSPNTSRRYARPGVTG
jgi:hypothetical protein